MSFERIATLHGDEAKFRTRDVCRGAEIDVFFSSLEGLVSIVAETYGRSVEIQMSPGAARRLAVILAKAADPEP